VVCGDIPLQSSESSIYRIFESGLLLEEFGLPCEYELSSKGSDSLSNNMFAP